MKLKVWWLPLVPGNTFYVDVDSVDDGKKVMKILAEYDEFQIENGIKSGLTRSCGLMTFDENDTTDGPDGSWVVTLY